MFFFHKVGREKFENLAPNNGQKSLGNAALGHLVRFEFCFVQHFFVAITSTRMGLFCFKELGESRFLNFKTSNTNFQLTYGI